MGGRGGEKRGRRCAGRVDLQLPPSPPHDVHGPEEEEWRPRVVRGDNVEHAPRQQLILVHAATGEGRGRGAERGV